MAKGYKIIPTKVARGRKIQVRQFEPEELWIEYSLTISDPKKATEAIDEASQMATIYLDAEEQKLRAKNQSPPQATPYTVNTSKPIPKPSPPQPEYDLELTSQGKAKSLHIAPSTNPQYKDFIHLWYRNNGKNELYVGYLKRDSGDFQV